MQIRRRVFRLSLLVGIIAGVVAFPASPTFAGSSHTTFSFVALPVALTLNDNSNAPTRHGLLRGTLTTANTAATHVFLTISVPASQLISLGPHSTNCTQPP